MNVLKGPALRFMAISLLGTGVALGEVSLPKLVGENMVLQRDEPITVWGWADPGENVDGSFRGQSRKIRTDRGGRWSVILGPFSAGGPYEMTVEEHNTICLHNILVGDVCMRRRVHSPRLWEKDDHARQVYDAIIGECEVT
jgi:sialate O-acetylesterase